MPTVSAGQRLGPYEVASLIGAGGMGEVYQARDTRLNRTVAIKVSREQFSERFEREAGIPKVLFQTSLSGGANARHVIRYDVTADGAKFLINSVPAATFASPEPITVVLNWTALLKK